MVEKRRVKIDVLIIDVLIDSDLVLIPFPLAKGGRAWWCDAGGLS